MSYLTMEKTTTTTTTLNLERIKRLTGDDDDLLQRVVQSFYGNISEVLPVLASWPEYISNEELRWHIHIIKPMLDYFGLETSQNCRNIKLIMAGQKKGDIGEEVDIIIQQLLEFRELAEREYSFL